MHADDVLSLGLGVTPTRKLVGQRLDTDKRPKPLWEAFSLLVVAHLEVCARYWCVSRAGARKDANVRDSLARRINRAQITA